MFRRSQIEDKAMPSDATALELAEQAVQEADAAYRAAVEREYRLQFDDSPAGRQARQSPDYAARLQTAQQAVQAADTAATAARVALNRAYAAAQVPFADGDGPLARSEREAAATARAARLRQLQADLAALGVAVTRGVPT
jgi:hypothetical protein